MARRRVTTERRESRFGIGEWYGNPFTRLSRAERRFFAEAQFLPRAERRVQPCPFRSTAQQMVPCWKVGGVCSLRRYERVVGGQDVYVASEGGSLRTTCPSRFEEGGEIYSWIAEVVLGHDNAMPIGQVNFLERVPLIGEADGPEAPVEEVGRLDNILVVPNTVPLQWCAVEIQAVYFSGDAMEREFDAVRAHQGDGFPFPAGRRRPDYRSSGPKRLMPQLQIKVPTLRRWGKKMAVVVDQDFFNAMGRMSMVDDITNCDVAWFVVRYDERFRVSRGGVYLTTLEESVQGLVAGRPVSLPEFEKRVLDKLSRMASGPSQISTD